MDLNEDHVIERINWWKDKFDISHWDIELERIVPEQVMYDDQQYFIGISRNFDKSYAIISHDIPLCEEAIVHELLHIILPHPRVYETFDEYEERIDSLAKALVASLH